MNVFSPADADHTQSSFRADLLEEYGQEKIIGDVFRSILDLKEEEEEKRREMQREMEMNQTEGGSLGLARGPEDVGMLSDEGQLEEGEGKKEEDILENGQEGEYLEREWEKELEHAKEEEGSKTQKEEGNKALTEEEKTRVGDLDEGGGTGGNEGNGQREGGAVGCPGKGGEDVFIFLSIFKFEERKGTYRLLLISLLIFFSIFSFLFHLTLNFSFYLFLSLLLSGLFRYFLHLFPFSPLPRRMAPAAVRLLFRIPAKRSGGFGHSLSYGRAEPSGESARPFSFR